MRRRLSTSVESCSGPPDRRRGPGVWISLKIQPFFTGASSISDLIIALYSSRIAAQSWQAHRSPPAGLRRASRQRRYNYETVCLDEDIGRVFSGGNGGCHPAGMQYEQL